MCCAVNARTQDEYFRHLFVANRFEHIVVRKAMGTKKKIGCCWLFSGDPPLPVVSVKREVVDQHALVLWYPWDHGILL